MALSNPGIKLGSPALQAYSLPTELSGKVNKLPEDAKAVHRPSFERQGHRIGFFLMKCFSQPKINMLLKYICVYVCVCVCMYVCIGQFHTIFKIPDWAQLLYKTHPVASGLSPSSM